MYIHNTYNFGGRPSSKLGFAVNLEFEKLLSYGKFRKSLGYTHFAGTQLLRQTKELEKSQKFLPLK